MTVGMVDASDSTQRLAAAVVEVLSEIAAESLYTTPSVLDFRDGRIDVEGSFSPIDIARRLEARGVTIGEGDG